MVRIPNTVLISTDTYMRCMARDFAVVIAATSVSQVQYQLRTLPRCS